MPFPSPHSDDPHLYPNPRYPNLGFSPEDVRYEVMTPEELVDRFDEIQDLRFRHYEEALRVHGYDFARFRPPEQVHRFVGKLTLETFSDPQQAVGSTARAFQQRKNPKIAVAYEDRTNRILGFTHGSENVSSKIQRVANKIHIPALLGNLAGGAERGIKHALGYYYIWTSEAVHDPELPALAPITTEQFLSQYDSRLEGSWWPYADEWALRSNLIDWDYRQVPQTTEDVDVEREFGPGAAPTTYSMWRTVGIGMTRKSITHAEPVIAREVKRAHEMLDQSS